jgi:hypothetical protein
MTGIYKFTDLKSTNRFTSEDLEDVGYYKDNVQINHLDFNKLESNANSADSDILKERLYGFFEERDMYIEDDFVFL